MVILNEIDLCKCTRVNTKIEKEQSMIDYAMVTEKEIQVLEKVIIDVEELFRIKDEAKRDHNTFIIKLRKIQKHRSDKNTKICFRIVSEKLSK